MAALDRWEREWQAENLARIRQYPVTAGRNGHAPRLWGRSRARSMIAERKLLYPAVNRPGASRRTIVSIDLRERQDHAAGRGRGPGALLRDVDGLRPEGQEDLLHQRQHPRMARSERARPRQRPQRRMLLKDCRAGRSGRESGRSVDLGHAASQRLLVAGPHSAAL